MQVRWTEMRVKKEDDQELQLKKLLSGEEQNNFQPEFFYDYAPMTFDINDISRFNRSQDKKSTTVRFKDGDSFVVALPYSEFQRIYTAATGYSIHGFITEKSGEGASNDTIIKPDSIDDFGLGMDSDNLS